MHMLVTPDLVVDVRDTRSRAMVLRVLGPLPVAAVRDHPPAVAVGGDLAPGVAASASYPVEVGAASHDHALWSALAVAGLLAGKVPLHGAAVSTAEGCTTIVGASGTGKTTALLAAGAGGAEVVAPEWVLVDGDGVVSPLPGWLRLRPHHLRRSAAWRARVGLVGRARLRAMSVLALVARPAPRLRAAAEHRLHVDVAIPRPQGGSSRLKRVVMLRSEAVDSPRVKRLGTDDAVAAIAALLRADVHLRWSGQPDCDPIGPSLDALLRERLARLAPDPVEITHHHPVSGSAFERVITEVVG